MPQEGVDFGKPVIFKADVPIRFGDIDRYNHVTTTAYLDFVFTSRFIFTMKEFGISPDDFLAKGLLFFNSRVEINFRTPIPSNQTFVKVESFVHSIDRAKLRIEFKIMDETGEKRHSDGRFDCVVIEAETQKPFSSVPSWLLKHLFQT